MEKKLSLTDAEWSDGATFGLLGSLGRALTAALEQKTGWSRSNDADTSAASSRKGRSAL